MSSMMKFIATMDGKRYEIGVRKDDVDPSQYEMEINGKSYSVDARRMPSQIVSLLMNGKSYDVDLERIAKRNDSMVFTCSGQPSSWSSPASSSSA